MPLTGTALPIPLSPPGQRSQAAAREAVDIIDEKIAQKEAAGVWVNWKSRRTLGGLTASFPKWPAPACGDIGPTPDVECSREPGHPMGRHMAGGSGAHPEIVAAWPGTHPPTKKDLT